MSRPAKNGRKPRAAAPSAAPDTWRQRGRRGGRRLTARRHAAAITAAEETPAAGAVPDKGFNMESTDKEWKAWGFYTEPEPCGTAQHDNEAGRAWDRNTHIDVTPPARDKRENPTPRKSCRPSLPTHNPRSVPAMDVMALRPAKKLQAESAHTQPPLGAGDGRHGASKARWGDEDEAPPWQRCARDWKSDTSAKGYWRTAWEWCDH